MTAVKNLVFFLAVFWVNVGWAFSLPGQALGQPKPAEEAFVLQSDAFKEQIILRWTIAPGHYLYQEKLKFSLDDKAIRPTLPAARTISDPYFGQTPIYEYQLDIQIEREQLAGGQTLLVSYMGCAEAGLCYPEQTQSITVPEAWRTAVALPPQVTVSENSSSIDRPGAISATGALAEGTLDWVVVLGFFALGVGLAFTPCVFPMYPILTGIITGQHQGLSVARAAGLSMAYVQGMAITYAGLGLVIASVGAQVQGYLQHPIMLVVASAIFVALAMSMFGVFQLSLPSSWQQKVDALSRKQSGGGYVSVFMMGALSGLIASPCTTAPLSAALMYVAKSGDLVTGFFVLYVLSLGMGLPLFLLGCSGGALLPKPGAWMNKVKHGFGFVLLLVPILLLERVLSEGVVLALFSLWVTSILFYVLNVVLIGSYRSWSRVSAVLFSQGLMAALVVVNLNYWYVKTEPVTLTSSAEFHTVSSVDELNVLLNSQPEKSILVDLYADWCVACKEFEHKTFPDPAVQAELEKRTLIKVDMTSMSDADKQFMQQHGVMGLPTLMLFNTSGKECASHRVSGFMSPEMFADHLKGSERATC